MSVVNTTSTLSTVSTTVLTFVGDATKKRRVRKNE